MADGAYLTTGIANVPLPRLLFPVEPQPNETLLGFVVRCVERNRLGTPVSFMRAVGLELKAKGDFLNRLQAELPALAQALSMRVASLDGLWGTEPPPRTASAVSAASGCAPHSSSIRSDARRPASVPVSLMTPDG